MGNVLLTALAVYVGAGLLMLVSTRLSIRVINRIVFQLREDIQSKLSRLPLSYFDRAKRGEVLSRATNDIDNISQTLQQTMGQLINSALTIVGVLIMMFWISPLLALVALVTVPLSVVVATKVGKRSQPQFVQQWKVTGKLNAHIEEMYTGHTLVKVFGRQEESAKDFAEQNDALYEASFRAQFNSGVMQPLMMFVSNLNYVLIAVVGGLRVASGALSIGDVQAFIQYSRQFSMPLTQVASMANLVQSGIASAERIFQLLDAEEQDPDPETGTRPAELLGSVSLEKVSFRYDPDKPLIENLSLNVEPGHTVAIVGPTGAGKTTLVNLLMRFYDVTGGRIALDGVDVAKMSRDELRSGIGMVLQDTWLFGGSIADNIAYGAAREVTREEIEEAARAAHADRFIRTLPDGYDTVIDDEGTGVSAGEKQLITIARAFLSDPVILVLDEATSSVDTRTEVLIQKAMARLAHGRTSFVIAHRLSTIRDADVILVMENGAIVEQGTHDELLDAQGRTPGCTRRSSRRRSPRSTDRFGTSSVQVAAELVGEGVVPQLVEGLGFDLADAFACHAEDPANLFECAGPPVGQPVAQLDHFPLALVQGGEHRFEVLAQQQERGGLHGGRRVPVLDQVAERDVVLLADRRVQRDGFLGEPQHFADPFRRQIELGGDLFGRRLVAALLEHPALDPHDAVDQLDDVDRDPYGACLVGEGAGHGLPDPPGRVRRELVAPGVVELLDGPDQSEVSLLDQIEHGQAAADVAFGDGDDEPQVRLDQAALRHPPHDHQPVEINGELGVGVRGGREPLLGEQAGFDAAGELHLVGGGEERDPSDLPQVLTEEVGGRAAGVGAATGLRKFGHLRLLLHEGVFRDGRLGRFGLVGCRWVHRRLRMTRGPVLRGDGRDTLGCGHGPGLHGGDLQVIAAGSRGWEAHRPVGRPRSDDSGTATQCGGRHIAATRGVRGLSESVP